MTFFLIIIIKWLTMTFFLIIIIITITKLINSTKLINLKSKQ